MPIGKNAIKRVLNNGYSNVKTEAPDMENSVIEEAKKPSVKKAPAKNPAPKGITSSKKSTSGIKNPAPKAAIMIDPKPAPKKKTVKAAVPEEKPVEKPVEKNIAEEKSVLPTPKKSMETEPELAPVRTAEKIIEKTEASDKSYTNLGRELPYYLL